MLLLLTSREGSLHVMKQLHRDIHEGGANSHVSELGNDSLPVEGSEETTTLADSCNLMRQLELKALS